MRSLSGVSVESPAPLVEHVPAHVASAGRDIIELVEGFDLHLDPWQQDVLVGAQGEREDGQHSAREVGVVVARQNGKDEILTARTLGGLLVLDEELITFSAHQFDTSLEAFRRLLFFFENYDELSGRVKRVSKSHGEEGIELKGGQRVRFRTRTAGGGRGFTGDCLFLNEAMILRESSMGALLPTLSARPNPQVWYTGSAVDEDVHEHGIVLARLRERALKGEDPALAYWEWAAARNHDELDPDDQDGWARANPALNVRINPEFVAAEQRAMDPRTFAVERLGVGYWPRVTGDDGSIISVKTWMSLRDPHSELLGDPLVMVLDVSPERESATVGVAGRRDDGLVHVETVRQSRGTAWVLDYLPERVQRHRPAAILYDERSPAAALVPELENRGVRMESINTTEYVQACGLFYDTVDQRGLRHLGTPELVTAVRGAATRPLGDAWAWSRKNSGVDITPLVACTIALWGLENRARSAVPLMAFR